MSGKPPALALPSSVALHPTACSGSPGPSGPNTKGTSAGSVFDNSVHLTIAAESAGTVSGTIIVTGATTVGGNPFNGPLGASTRQLTWTMNPGGGFCTGRPCRMWTPELVDGTAL